MRVECQTCRGHYDTVLPDGSEYYHVCPPLSAWEVRAAIAAGASPLTPAQTAALTKADNPKPDPVTAIAPPPGGDGYLQSLALPRPNARNENVDPKKVKALRDPDTGNLPKSLPPDALVVSAGAGALELIPIDEGL